MRTEIRLAAIGLLVAACSSAPSPAPASAEAPSAQPTASAAAVSSAPPSATGTRAWPSTFDVELHGTYAADPPFRIPFTITVEEPGWYSGHLHDTFVDLQRFDGVTPHQFPNRILGFGDPDHIRGGGGDVDVAGLTPGGALDLLAGRASLATSNRAAYTLFGLEGMRLDVHSATNSNALFGNGADNFGLGPELDVRLVLLPREGRLLVVAVLAAPGDLEGAWEQARSLLSTARLAG